MDLLNWLHPKSEKASSPICFHLLALDVLSANRFPLRNFFAHIPWDCLEAGFHIPVIDQSEPSEHLHASSILVLLLPTMVHSADLGVCTPVWHLHAEYFGGGFVHALAKCTGRSSQLLPLQEVLDAGASGESKATWTPQPCRETDRIDGQSGKSHVCQ